MISKTTILTTFFIFSAFLEALPTGAPLNTCQTMLPRHNAEPIDSDNPPYEIVYSPVNNFTLKVTLQSKQEDLSFRGFLIQARRQWNGEAIGKWSTSEDSTKTIDCFDRENSAVTHDHKQNSQSRKMGFNKLTFVWTCPQEQTLDGVILIATVAESAKVIYVNVSNVIHVEKPKVEAISFDEFGETTEEVMRDSFDFEKVSRKGQPEESVNRDAEMDIERMRPVEMDEIKNEVVDRNMGRINRLQVEEEPTKPISADNEKLSQRTMKNQKLLTLEEPAVSLDSSNDQEDLIKSEKLNKLKSIVKKKLMPVEPKKSSLAMDKEIETNRDLMMEEKKEETKSLKDFVDNRRKLVSATDLLEGENKSENVVVDKQETQNDQERNMEVERLKAQIRVLNLKLRKILESN